MTILFKNTQLIDGSGRESIKADVLIKNDKISAIGNFPKYQADEIIDGMGSYLAPGFIDINTSFDHYLNIFSNFKAENYLLQGVTSIIGGQGGASLAPLIYGSLESIQEWADINKVNIDWQTMKEFLEIMENFSLGINFGTLVGHTTIRQALTDKTKRDLSQNELKVFNMVLKKSLKAGAFGFSTDLDYLQNNKISYQEIEYFIKTVIEQKSLYATQFQDEKKSLLFSIKELIRIAKETGVKILINNFHPIIGFENDYNEALNLIDKNIDEVDISFSVSPFKKSVVLIHNLLPIWAQKEDKIKILKDIENKEFKERILKDLFNLNAEKIIIINAPNNEYLNGKSLKEFSQNRNLNFNEGLLELMKLTEFRATIFYENINFKKIIESLKHKAAIIASGGAGFNLQPEYSFNAFTEFLKLVNEKNIMPLEKAVYKITGLPAQKLELKNRGFIAEGFFADMVLFKDSEIREVLINGKRVIKEGKFQNIFKGRVLKK
ncbi:hypothetical protein JW698_00555 [Candidatus Wolfebacteria bacterium]|nr:hypothetical protein [Candidatus Wolfebacteria bacterium]